MNKFSKIMLLGLLSIVTGAASVEGAIPKPADITGLSVLVTSKCGSISVSSHLRFGITDSAQLLARIKTLKDQKYQFVLSLSDVVINQDKKSTNYIESIAMPENPSIEQVDNFVKLSKSKKVLICGASPTSASISMSDKSRIATLYTCWMIKNENAIWPSNGNVNLFGESIALTKQQMLLVRAYFLKCNGLCSVQEQPCFASRHKGKIILLTTLAAAALVASGNYYYDTHCAADSSSAMCMATSPANAITTYAAAGGACAYGFASTQFGNLKKWYYGTPAPVSQSTALDVKEETLAPVATPQADDQAAKAAADARLAVEAKAAADAKSARLAVEAKAAADAKSARLAVEAKAAADAKSARLAVEAKAAADAKSARLAVEAKAAADAKSARLAVEAKAAADAETARLAVEAKAAADAETARLAVEAKAAADAEPARLAVEAKSLSTAAKLPWNTAVSNLAWLGKKLGIVRQ